MKTPDKPISDQYSLFRPPENTRKMLRFSGIFRGIKWKHPEMGNFVLVCLLLTYPLRYSVHESSIFADNIWLKVFKYGPSKACGGKPLKKFYLVQS